MEFGWYEQRWVGLRIGVTAYRENGWDEGERETWESRGEQTLADFLVSVIRLPVLEANELAIQIEGPWREEWLRDGGSDYLRSIHRFGMWTMLGVSVVLLLALTGVALLVWLVVTLI